jgi:hypothetical protein
MRLRAVISGAFALGIVAWGNSVAAAPQGHERADTPTLKRWYGWETLSLDAAALGLGAMSFATYDGQGTAGALLGSGALSTYAFGAPAVHLLRAQSSKAVTSLGLRIGLPVLAVGIASVGRDSSCAQDSASFDAAKCQPQRDRMMLAGVISVVAASLLDGAFVAWEPPPVPRKLSLSPVLAWDGEKGGVAGVAGAF